MVLDNWQPPSWSARECDLDSPQITITMQPVPPRAERVFRVDPKVAAELEAARYMYRYFTTEMGYDNYGLGVGENDHLWLVRTDHARHAYSLTCGGAEVLRNEDGPSLLRWIWVHPMWRGERRRTRIAMLLWNKLLEEYGELELEGDVSNSMKNFMGKLGD